MRNFILFIVVVSVLGVAGFVVYRVYYKGETINEALQELKGSEEKPDTLADATDAYHEGNYAEALKGYTLALQAYESNDPGGALEENEYKNLLLQIASCYKNLWEEGGKTDDTLRFKALHAYERYAEEFSGTYMRNVGRMMAELRNPTSAPASTEEAPDESPPK